MATFTRVREARFTGAAVAECDHCTVVCVSWDADDCDPETGLPYHECEARNYWGTLITDVGEGFCPQCEREAPFHYKSCPLRVPR